MRRHDAPVVAPPAAIEAAVRDYVEGYAAKWFPEDASNATSPMVTLEPWRVRYWSFLRRAAISWGGAAHVVWIKIPKDDPGARSIESVVGTASHGATVRREAAAHERLASVGWGAPGAPPDARFVRYLDCNDAIGVVVTEHAPEPPLTPALRRAKRRFAPAAGAAARGAMRRAGSFLRHAHARLPAPETVRAERRAATLARFDAALAALESSSLRFEPAARLRAAAPALRSRLQSGYDVGVPLVATHRGVDVRNLLDDGARQTWIDPQESVDDVAWHDLARFVATLGILDYGSLRGFAPPAIPRPWVDAFLEGYGAPTWITPPVLTAFTILWLLDRFEDSRRLLQVQPWSPALRGLLDTLYTRRFFEVLVGDALTELGAA